MKRLLLVWRYPGYLKYMYHTYVVPWLVERNGVELGGHVSFIGFPIISIAPGSNMKIGSGALLCSEPEHTALGVNHPVVLRTLRRGARLEIGEGVRMSGTTICAVESVSVGKRCCLGANVTIADTDFHSLDHVVRSSESDQDYATHSPVAIGSDVFIGAGCYILKGVTIGEGAVVGAGSVVSRSIPPFAIAAGNPASVLGMVHGADVRGSGLSG